ncbi:delta(3,5)-Delta(2,4)-dienoyl-CoA isomerase, peroxisomal isoform X2 [Solanum verrucosum]|uniref:delta(3,5)-Delta(2,4)-dienoyl-CoA isomerase, peroxisomal isoform X2 n=1 Tax=Solanum verrucosum TaxID=315347 RepID=UPI0020D11691|nr:delta(3,5)-Delta(2,4)-dienoyl-CoA isomerase, peroxisomal isoform X2 [Solanum verrucosum]
MEEYKSLKIIQKSPNSLVYYLYLNRSRRFNALSHDFFTEFPKAISSLDQNPNVAVIILAGSGKHFCSSVNFQTLADVFKETHAADCARNVKRLQRHIKFMQEAITALECCRKPVIAAVHGACIGGAIDLITACDIRYCSSDAFFSIKEVDLAMTADLGILQRLPSIVGSGNAMELALTGRRFTGSEAKDLCLVSKVFTSKEALEEGVKVVADEIATKSPLAVIGTKAVLLRSRDLTVEQGLDYVATWNSGTLLSDDLKEAISAHSQKRKPKFAKL